MPILKSGNREQFLIKILEPVASNCCHRCVEDEASVLFNWLSPEPDTMSSPVSTRSGFLIESDNGRTQGQTTVHGQVGRASLGYDLCTLRQFLERGWQ